MKMTKNKKTIFNFVFSILMIIDKEQNEPKKIF